MGWWWALVTKKAALTLLMDLVAFEVGMVLLLGLVLDVAETLAFGLAGQVTLKVGMGVVPGLVVLEVSMAWLIGLVALQVSMTLFPGPAVGMMMRGWHVALEVGMALLLALKEVSDQ